MSTNTKAKNPTTASHAASTQGSADSAQGSNVRETFILMSSLFYPKIPVGYLDLCAKILQKRHMETVFEERAVQLLCAFPPCGNKLSEKTGKYRISLARKEIYDAETENKFCSQHCLKKARVFVSKLVSKPPQLVPSMMEVFGTNKPNPFDFEDMNKVSLAEATSGQIARPVPLATSVWAKTKDLGIVERKNLMQDVTATPPTLAATAPALKENTNPQAPDRNFPDAKQAVLIEGFVFPAHKQPLAKKVEKLLQKPENKNKDEVVVSDSDESGDESDYDDASSTGSFALSDFDEEELISLDDLPLFVNLWGLFSAWITHETTLIVAGLPMPPKQEEENKLASKTARQMFTDRWNALSTMMYRPMSQVALKLGLVSDRYVNRKIDLITKTFALRDAIDSRNSHQWTCVAVILLLVAHGKTPDDVSKDELSQVKAITKLDTHELRQLLALFYDLRNDSEITVDTDVAVVEESDIETTEIPQRTSDNEQITICRKCRRSSNKCICKARHAQPVESFTTSDVEAMLQEALVLREEYEELLDA